MNETFSTSSRTGTIDKGVHTYSTRQVLVWEVSRLIELSRDLPVLDVRLDELPIWDPEMDGWKVQGLDAFIEHMRRVLDADLSYPIILSAEGFVMDGCHRAALARLHGYQTIKAVRFPTNPPPDRVGTDLEPSDSTSIPVP